MEDLSKRFTQEGGNLYSLHSASNPLTATEEQEGGKLSPKSKNWRLKYLEIKKENKQLKKKIKELESKIKS